MADEAGRILLKCLSKGGRKLRREMVVHMNKDDIQEERIMVQGGDIRQRGNQWLRKAWQKSGVTRVPREAEFRKIVRSLASQYNLCPGLDDEAKQAWIREEAAKCHRVVIRHKKVGGRPSSASTKSAQGLLLIKLTRNLPCCRAWMMKLC
ncbi:unnamed protein product [Durusdinium trenchii]|uniref:Uncharacterized protein n=1 Tax=Durusdinium trenchii TaxID=1381693 RepID=A0ABP0MLQ1_9DINO